MTDEAVVAPDRGDEHTPEVETPDMGIPASETEVAETPKVDDKPREEDGKFIPKGVFDNRLRGEREAREAAERRAQELEAQLGQVSRTEDVAKVEEKIVALEQQHAKLLLDGEHEKAALAMRDIRLMERQVAIQQATHLSAQSKDQAREEMRMELAIERLESTHSVLNPAHADYDQELVDEVLDLQQVYMGPRHRMSPSQSLSKAVEKVMRSAEGPPAARPGLGAAAARKDDQLSKNLATDKAQPASLKDAGMDSDKAGVVGTPRMADLTPEQYEALPESTKAKLRGDVL